MWIYILTIIFLIDPAAAAASQAQQQASQQGAGGQQQQQQQGATESGTIRATEPMWRCSKILQMQRDYHPTVLVSLEGIVDQVWAEEFTIH